MSSFSTAIGAEVLIGKFIITTGIKGPEIFKIEASPLNGWYLCRQVNDMAVKASVLFRLEDLKSTNTLFFDLEDEAKRALPELSQKTVAEALGKAPVEHRP